MTNILAELPLIRSQRLQGLPLEFPLVVEVSTMEATDQHVMVDSHVEGNPVVEAGEEFTSYDNPFVVQQPPVADTSFNFQMEGQTGSSDLVFNHPFDDTIGVEFRPNAPL